jgi:uncharacterized SAM-binding protein YcdF (DUF218 family)
MLLLLSKLLPLPFYPVGLAIILGLVALVLIGRRMRRAAFVFCAVAVGVLLLFSLPITAHLLTRGLEGRYDPQRTYPRSSAIVLLGGAGVPALPPRLYPETGPFADRIMHAARLYHQDLAPILIVTGGKITFVSDFEGCEAENNAFLLRELMGVDSADIVIEGRTRNTREDALAVVNALSGRDVPYEIILVTSAVHMPRSVALMKKVGLTVHPAPCDFSAEKHFQWRILNLLPRASALYGSTVALHEYYGLLAYRLLGWI